LSWEYLNDSGKIHMTITPKNLNFFEACKEFYENGVYHIHLDEVFSSNSNFQFSYENLELLKEEYTKLSKYIIKLIKNKRKISCRPLLNSIHRFKNLSPRIRRCGVFDSLAIISPEGDIYPCDVLMRDEFKVGNLDNGLDKAKINEIINDIERVPDCKNCWARYICGGACYGQLMNVPKNQWKIKCELNRYICKLQIFIYTELCKDEFFVKNICKK
jgi:uncharacterized protein